MAAGRHRKPVPTPQPTGFQLIGAKVTLSESAHIVYRPQDGVTAIDQLLSDIEQAYMTNNGSAMDVHMDDEGDPLIFQAMSAKLRAWAQNPTTPFTYDLRDDHSVAKGWTTAFDHESFTVSAHPEGIAFSMTGIHPHGRNATPRLQRFAVVNDKNVAFDSPPRIDLSVTPTPQKLEAAASRPLGTYKSRVDVGSNGSVETVSFSAKEALPVDAREILTFVGVGLGYSKETLDNAVFDSADESSTDVVTGSFGSVRFTIAPQGRPLGSTFDSTTGALSLATSTWLSVDRDDSKPELWLQIPKVGITFDSPDLTHVEAIAAGELYASGFPWTYRLPNAPDWTVSSSSDGLQLPMNAAHPDVQQELAAVFTADTDTVVKLYGSGTNVKTL